jgi:hypothetical protein
MISTELSSSSASSQPSEGTQAQDASFLRRNGLSLVFALLFVGCAVGQAMAGLLAYNQELAEHGRAALSLLEYIQSGHFLEATFENWESEFLQMGLFVALTVGLRQKGSSESKDLEGDEPVDEDPRAHRHEPDVPWPVRRGGVVLRVYEHSLTLALFMLFAASFALHCWGGLREVNAERALHAQPPETLGGYLGSPEFWYQSMQNWQSEFLAVVAIVLLSVHLRERGSAQSKPVAATHDHTGNS